MLRGKQTQYSNMWTAHESHQVIIPYYVSSCLQIPLLLSTSHYLPCSSSLFQDLSRVFFKTGVIDIEALIKHRQLCLTETMKGGEAGEKKAGAWLQH